MDIGFNPTTWLILAAIMIVIEIITLGLSTVWFAGGAAAAALAAGLDAPEWVQVVIFMVVSAGMIFLLRPIAKRRLNLHVVPTNAQSLVGTKVKVLKLTDKPGIAVTRINDVEWRIGYEGQVKVGDDLEVEEISGTKLICKKP